MQFISAMMKEEMFDFPSNKEKILEAQRKTACTMTDMAGFLKISGETWREIFDSEEGPTDEQTEKLLPFIKNFKLKPLSVMESNKDNIFNLFINVIKFQKEDLKNLYILNEKKKKGENIKTSKKDLEAMIKKTENSIVKLFDIGFCDVSAETLIKQIQKEAREEIKKIA